MHPGTHSVTNASQPRISVTLEGVFGAVLMLLEFIWVQVSGRGDISHLVVMEDSLLNPPCGEGRTLRLVRTHAGGVYITC